MGKVRLIPFFCLELAFGLFRVHAGDMFVVKDKCYLPLFENNKETRLFEKGKKGCNCDDLDTVLLPGSVIEVLGYKENGMAEVKCKMTEKVKHEGYVYKSSIENFCEKFEEGGVNRERSPMSLEEIRSVFKRCLDEKVPYCWGSNQFEKISLSGVTFTSKNEGEQYECRGFDCSGLLYYISDGTLPHATGALKNFGTLLFTIEAGQIWHETFIKEVDQVVAKLKDTDFIVIKGHVIVAYNGGLIEFRSKDLGCCFTSPEDVISQDESQSNKKDPVREKIKNPVTLRVYDLWVRAKNSKSRSDVWFMRWHPECLRGK